MDISFKDGRGTGSSGKCRLKEYYWFGSKKRYTYPVELKKSPSSLKDMNYSKASHYDNTLEVNAAKC